jgi:hypothetical protein
MKFIDLHVHTTASDGTFTPAEAVVHAKLLGLSALAVTDHDTPAGLPEALEAGRETGVEVVPGIEVSVDWRGRGIHVLGYFIDPAAPSLRHLLSWVVAERRRRNEAIAAQFRADGIPITVEGLARSSPESVIGRPHFAAALVELGYASDVNDAFRRYLNRDQRYYRKRSYIPLRQAFEVIRDAGGKAVMAHPLQYKLPEEELLVLVRTLVDAGAVGMECLYSQYDAEDSAYLMGLAERFGLCVTGGSDFHGARKPIEMGTPAVPYELLERLRER